MAYAGLVPREHSSGVQTRRGGTTKTGNAHARFVLGEEAWAYRHRPAVKAPLRSRQQGVDPEVLRISLKAQTTGGTGPSGTRMAFGRLPRKGLSGEAGLRGIGYS